MSGPEDAPPEGRAPTAEEMAAMLAERLAQTPVRDVLLQSMATFIDMAGLRLGMGPQGDEVRDLDQARQAIEALRALLAVAERELGAAQVRPFREPLAILQMAYSREAEAPAPPAPDAAVPPPAADPDAASRIWVPPGTRRPGSEPA